MPFAQSQTSIEGNISASSGALVCTFNGMLEYGNVGIVRLNAVLGE